MGELTQEVTLPQPMVFYLVRNREGKYFRAKGYGGYGDTWVADVTLAKVYQKISQARSRVTFFAKNWPDYGVPEILMITSPTATVLDQKERTAKAIKKSKDAELARQQAHAEYEKKRLEKQITSLTLQRKQLG